MKKKVFAIGLTGPNAAGKGLASKFFIERGFAYFSLSDVVREEAKKMNLSTSRDDLIFVGTKLREKFGLSVLAERTTYKLKEKNIVDSFRHPAEVNYFRENVLFFYLLGIDASPDLRYERAKKRMREGDSIGSFEDFLKKEESENSDGAGQQLKKTFQLADEIVENSGSKDDLNKKLEPIYNKLMERWNILMEE